jgi:cytochrome P450
MARRTERMLATWPDGEVRELYRELARLTLANVAEALFGDDVGGAADTVAAALTTLAREQSTARASSVLALLPAWVPTPGNLRARRAVRRLDRIIGHVIARRRAGDGQGDDLLAILLRARSDDPARMTARQLRDEALTFLLANLAADPFTHSCRVGEKPGPLAARSEIGQLKEGHLDRRCRGAPATTSSRKLHRQLPCA